MFLASRRELIFNETSCTILDNLSRDLVGPLPLSLSLFFLFHRVEIETTRSPK